MSKFLKISTAEFADVSTAEADNYSASTAAAKVLYLRFLLDGLRFAQERPTPIHEDNAACIEWG